MPANPVVYWELVSHDAAATCRFLEAVFDWHLERDSSGIIWELPSGEDRAAFAGGGVFTLARPGCLF